MSHPLRLGQSLALFILHQSAAIFAARKNLVVKPGEHDQCVGGYQEEIVEQQRRRPTRLIGEAGGDDEGGNQRPAHRGGVDKTNAHVPEQKIDANRIENRYRRWSGCAAYCSRAMATTP